MAVAVGDRFVRRHNAARSTTANTTAADITYDTAVFNDGSGYTYTGPHVAADTAGLYLFVYDLGQCDLASTRAVGTLVPRINGSTDKTTFRATQRFLRNAGSSQHGSSIGFAILDLAANDNVRVRNPGALAPTDAVGDYATNASYGGAMQLLKLPDNNFTHVERTTDANEVGASNINATRPWVDGSGTWTQITFNSEISDDDALYSGSGGDITLKANNKYMIVWGATTQCATVVSRNAKVVRLQIGGTNVQTGSNYERTSDSQGGPVGGIYLHEVGGSDETLKLHATQEIEGTDGGTPSVSDAYVQVLELDSGTEWIHVDNGATDSLTTALANTATWYDTPLSSTLRAHGSSDLSLDSANDAVQNDSGASMPVLAIGWHRWDRDAGSSATRKTPWTRWDNGGTAVGYGVAAGYSRGSASDDDTWQAHYASAVLLDLANAADLSFQVNDEADGTNNDMGVYASTSRYFLGVQVLDLNTLAGSSSQTLNGALFSSTNTFPTGAVQPQPITATGSLFSSTNTFPTGAVTATFTATGVLFTSTNTFPTGAVQPQLVTVSGALFTSTNTFPTGAVQPQPITATGSLFSSTNTFPAGAVQPQPVTVSGALFTSTNTFPTGAVQTQATTLIGVLFTSTNTFPQGAVQPQPVTVSGVLFASTNTWTAGTLNQTVLGGLFTSTNTFPTGAVQPQPVTVSGVLFTSTNTWNAGSASVLALGDITVHRGEITDFGADENTRDYTTSISESDNTFLRFMSARHEGAFGADAVGSTLNRNVDDLLVGAQLLAAEDIRVQRASTGLDVDLRLKWEAWEYTGSGGGPNEFVTRERGSFTLANGVLSASSVPVAVTDAADCWVNLVGVEPEDQAWNLNRAQIRIDRSANSGTTCGVTVARGSAIGAVTVFYELVEFTGSNWILERLTPSLTVEGATETFTLETATGLWSRKFILSSTTNGTTDGDHSYHHLVFSADTPTSINYYRGASAADVTVTTFVLESMADVTVEHKDSVEGGEALIPGATASPDTHDVTVTAVGNTDTAGVIAQVASNYVDGYEWPRNWWQAALTSTTNVEFWRSRHSESLAHWALQVVDFSDLEQAPAETTSITLPVSLPTPTFSAPATAETSVVTLSLVVPAPSAFTGVNVPDPTAGRNTGLEFGQYYRLQEPGKPPRLSLVPVGRSQRVGLKAAEGHAAVSNVFAYRSDTEEDIDAAMADAWAANKSADTATLKAAINTALDALGFKGPAGVSLV